MGPALLDEGHAGRTRSHFPSLLPLSVAVLGPSSRLALLGAAGFVSTSSRDFPVVGDRWARAGIWVGRTAFSIRSRRPQSPFFFAPAAAQGKRTANCSVTLSVDGRWTGVEQQEGHREIVVGHVVTAAMLRASCTPVATPKSGDRRSSSLIF